MFKSYFVLFLSVFRVIQTQYDIGDSCELDGSRSGVCKIIHNCEYAEKRIYNDQDSMGVEICGWEGRTSIVCCPEGDQNYRTGPYSQHFDSCDSDVIINKDTICRYKGDLPMICCPKSPNHPPPAEPAGCSPLPQIKTPTFDDQTHAIAWRKCVENRRIVQMCEADERSFNGYRRTYTCNAIEDVQRIATDDPAGSAAKPKEFPHMAVLGCNNKKELDDAGDSAADIVWIGGGSLISERYILTAGHVLKENTYGPLRYALLGATNKTDVQNGDLYYIVRRIPHKTYVFSEKHDDIALLELNRQVIFSEYIYPICLPVPGIKFDATQRIIAGWGQTGPHRPKSDLLLKAYVNEVKSSDCIQSLKSQNFTWDDRIMTCARGLKPLNGQYPDSCQGDSGGPLMARVKNEDLLCNYVITGVVSWGPNCGTGAPAAYTKVAPYINWIVNTVW